MMKYSLIGFIFLSLGTAMLTVKSEISGNYEQTVISNLFGTDGVRGPVGTSPFTQPELHHLGYAIGSWVIKKYGPYATILLGHDTRVSCSWVKSCIKGGLLMHPINIIDAGVLPTPAIVFLTLKHDHINCGIIISASHNPYHDNGIKLIDGTRGKLSQDDEQQITQLFYAPAAACNYTQLGQETYWDKVTQIYMQAVSSFFTPQFLAEKKIVLDCAHGATYQIAPLLFKQFGAEVICIGANPDGININDHCGAVHVEQLQQAVIAQQADFGFAFDGDGDRVIAVNKLGQIKDGDALLALLLDHPAYKSTTAVVGTIMTNKGFEDWLVAKNYPLIRTPVGDKYIARCMQKEQGRLTLGGEQSGHIILYDYLPTGDGIFTALRVTQAAINNNNEQMVTFTRMPQILINVPIKDKKDLTQEPFASLIKEQEKALPGGRIIVRFSGTEAKLRVMVEDNDEQQAYTVGHALAHALQQALGG